MDQLPIIERTNFRRILNQHYQLPSLFTASIRYLDDLVCYSDSAVRQSHFWRGFEIPRIRGVRPSLELRLTLSSMHTRRLLMILSTC